jgi:hypothetical protein
MDAAAEVMIRPFEPGQVDLKLARHGQRRKQVQVSRDRRPAIEAYDTRFLNPRT